MTESKARKKVTAKIHAWKWQQRAIGESASNVNFCKMVGISAANLSESLKIDGKRPIPDKLLEWAGLEREVINRYKEIKHE